MSLLNKCQTIEDGVRAILKIYEQEEPDWQYCPATDDDYCDRLIVNGKDLPLFWWRADIQTNQMLGMAPARDLCSMKLNRTCSRQEGLDRLLYRELDIAELTLDAPIRQIMCYRREHSLTMLATLSNQRVALMELAAVLHPDTPEQGRHSYWGKNGMASDRVVSQKTAAQAVYLFTDESETPQTYNDIFLYTYGLNKTDSTKAAAIAEILMGWVDVSDWHARDEHYGRCIAAAHTSAKTETRVEVL